MGPVSARSPVPGFCDSGNRGRRDLWTFFRSFETVVSAFHPCRCGHCAEAGVGGSCNTGAFVFQRRPRASSRVERMPVPVPVDVCGCLRACNERTCLHQRKILSCLLLSPESSRKCGHILLSLASSRPHADSSPSPRPAQWNESSTNNSNSGEERKPCTTGVCIFVSSA